MSALPRVVGALRWKCKCGRTQYRRSSYQSGINVLNSQEPVIYAVHLLILHSTLKHINKNTDCLVILLQTTCGDAKISMKEKKKSFVSFFPQLETIYVHL